MNNERKVSCITVLGLVKNIAQYIERCEHDDVAIDDTMSIFRPVVATRIPRGHKK